MSDSVLAAGWWELHLRKARGQALAPEELRRYEAELSRQDGEAAPLNCGLAALITMRADLAQLGQANAALRSRLGELDDEVRAVEKSLSRETREALGVKD